jgi:hypothetical protein
MVRSLNLLGEKEIITHFSQTQRNYILFSAIYHVDLVLTNMNGGWEQSIFMFSWSILQLLFL